MIYRIKNEKKLQRTLLIIFIIVLLGFIYRYHSVIGSFFSDELNRRELQHFLRQHDKIGAVLLLLLIIISLIVPGIPTALLFVIGGAVYGYALGLFINVLGSFTGNLTAILLFRRLDNQSRYHSSKYLRNFKRLLKKIKNPYLALMIGYLIPVIPTSLVNFYLSQLKLTIRQQVKMVLIAVLPVTFIYTFSGGAITRGNLMLLLFAIIIIGLTILISQRLITRKHI